MPAELSPRHTDEQTQAAARSLRNKTCVVTGSSRGIGRAIALELARDGAQVIVNYCTSPDAAHTVADEIDAGDGEALVVQADVGERADVMAMADRVHDEVGPVDVLVNNAGVTIDRRFDQLSWDDWTRVIEVNLGGAFRCSKAFYEDLREADHGRVINISSVIASRGNYGQTNYAASKSGLVGFTRSLALELAPTGATANCVAPGYTRTDMIEHVRADIRDTIRKQIPLDRFATPQEIASSVRFLATDEAAYITGEVLNVNGGMPC